MLPVANGVVCHVQRNQMEGCDTDTELLSLNIVKKLEYYCGSLNMIFTKQMEKDLYLISKECNKFIDNSVTIQRKVQHDSFTETATSASTIIVTRQEVKGGHQYWYKKCDEHNRKLGVKEKVLVKKRYYP